MIELKGTPKQVAWANDRRNNAIELFPEAVQRLDNIHGLTDIAKQLVNKVVEEMKQNEKAEYWINLPLNSSDIAAIIWSSVLKKAKEMKK